MIEHRQRVCKLTFERMLERARSRRRTATPRDQEPRRSVGAVGSRRRVIDYPNSPRPQP
jgi:hypothetical protein